MEPVNARRAKRARWVAAFVILLLVSSSAPVLADSQADDEGKSQLGPLPTFKEIGQAIGDEEAPLLEPELTDPEAAEGAQLSNLERDEALELLEDVFVSALSSPAGIFDELHVAKFLAPNVALIAAGEQPEDPASPSGAPGTPYDGATLMDSTVPLGTEDSTGELRAVDLNLDAQGEGLRPVNPLVDVVIPSELGESIEIPGPGIEIDLEDAPEDRAPSKVDGSVAFYPNVASDTDFVVAPNPGGIETMTQLRSADAPTEQTYHLGLPSGATLEAKGGGAVVTDGAEALMTVSPPSAIDATGTSVPAELTVGSDTVTVRVSPSQDTAFPVLVDPLFQSFEWYAKKQSYDLESWNGESWGQKWGQNPWYGTAGLKWVTDEHMTAFVPYGSKGLDAYALSTTVPGAEDFWIYKVPRYNSDPELPETFISKMTASNVAWRAQSNALSPYMYMGLWGPSAGWASIYTHEGLNGHSINNLPYVYSFTNSLNVPDVKIGQVGLYSTETVSQGNVELFVGATTVELSEPPTTVPKFSEIVPPTGWINEGKAFINFKVSDRGLGVLSVRANGSQGSPPPTWKTVNDCTGVANDPCPLIWKFMLGIEPALLPAGTNNLSLVAEDPLGHVSTGGVAQVKVDHAAPSLTVSGTATEQGTLGKKRPTYTVNVTDADGTAANPQSGVAKVSIAVDGAVVKKAEPGCATQNCVVPLEWTLDASQYTAGQHTITATVTDGVGLSTSKTINIELQAAPPPTVALSGTMTEQASIGVTRPRYALKTSASTESGFNGTPMTPATFITSFGGTGTGKGQFNGVRGSAVDSKGNLWVIDWEGGRVEGLNAKGEYLSQFGEPGTNPGQLKMPLGLAIDAAGNFWVTGGDGRIQEFSSAGKFIKQFGKEGSTDGSFKNPLDIAIDSKGSLWILENSRVQVLDQEGKFLFKFGTQGKGNGQLSAASGIALAPDGSAWVADSSNNRIQKFDATGKFLAAYGEEGTGNGNLSKPNGIDIDQSGNVYVADGANRRVQVFNAAGEYLTQFGSIGSGPGQFEFPSYLSIDPSGNIWVDDGSSKVQRWRSQVAPPTFAMAFGSKGTGAGQFTTPSSVAADSAGNLWVVDRVNARIEKFNSKGEFLIQFGTKGSGAGQLSSPWGIVIDPSANVWVTDTTNTRVVEFNSKGDFVATFGTNVNKTKVEAGGTQAEKNLCTAASKHVCQAGTAGSAEGQMKQPTGITATAGGNLFVVEKGNGRVEKFSPTGELLANFGKPGTTLGQLSEPTAVAMSPDGNYLWVADSGNSRIQEWTSTYSFVRSVGEEGEGNGQFLEPYGLTVDNKGNVWVADTWLNRIQGFNANGEFLTKFGKSGSGEGQLAYPYSLTGDANGNIWIADTSHNQIQKWIPPTSKASTVTSEITIDGKAVSTKVGRCGTEACAIASEFVLENATYLGKHTVQVKATDALGRSTAKTLAIELQKDTTNPSIEVSGGLVTAPEGWVEQQSYGLNATATDAGYGVTSLAAKIDGQQVASWTGSCPDGGCTATISKSLDMSAYSGGSHPAELIATDGAGNVTKKAWTINVDPEGHVSATEAEETLEAADVTSESTVVAPTSEVLEPEQIEHGLNPGLNQTGSEIVSTGSPDVTTMTTDPGDGFTIHSPDGATEITPIVSENASAISISEGVAGVSANIGSEVDSVIRPEYNGVQTFQAIRSSTSPETYSWKVHLPSGQGLRLANPSQAEVFYADGTIAFLITAEPAHDATGKPVPTSLEVKNEILTLKVEFHTGAFVYPVVAGQGWETSYTAPVIVEGPEDEAEIIQREREEREQREQEERERLEAEGVTFSESEELPPPPTPLSEKQAKWLVSFGPFGTDAAAPPYPSEKGASASTIRTFQIYKSSCGPSCAKWNAHVYNASFLRGFNWAKWEPGTEVHAGVSQSWKYEALIWDTTWNCGTVGPTFVKKGSGEHMIAYAKFTMESWFLKKGGPTATPTENNFALQDWVYPNGFQEKHVKGFDGQPEHQVCPRVAGT